MLAAAVVVEVGPPLAADEAGLLVKELALDTVALCDDRTFPFPQGPVPTTIVEYYITAVVGDGLLGRKSSNATIQQRQEPYLLNEGNESCR